MDTKETRVFMRISVDEKERIRRAAEVTDTDMSKLMRDAVMSRVKRIEKQESANE